MNNNTQPNTHWHVGTSCCEGAGDDCEHERQFDKDTDNDTQELGLHSLTQIRLNKRLMVLQPYPCEGF